MPDRPKPGGNHSGNHTVVDGRPGSIGSNNTTGGNLPPQTQPLDAFAWSTMKPIDLRSANALARQFMQAKDSEKAFYCNLNL